jgi:hypothetical protein
LALEADRRSDRRIQYSGKSGSYYEQEQYTTSCRLNLTQHVQLTIQDESNDINQKKKSIHDLHSIRSRSTQATQSASISSSRAHTHTTKKTNKSFFVIPNPQKSILPAISKSLSSKIPLLIFQFKRIQACCLIAASRATGLAPTTSPTCLPSLNSRKVGMARTDCSWATSGTSSTSTL